MLKMCIIIKFAVPLYVFVYILQIPISFMKKWSHLAPFSPSLSPRSPQNWRKMLIMSKIDITNKLSSYDKASMHIYKFWSSYLKIEHIFHSLDPYLTPWWPKIDHILKKFWGAEYFCKVLGYINMFWENWPLNIKCRKPLCLRPNRPH